MSPSHHTPSASHLSLAQHSLGVGAALPPHIVEFRDQLLALCHGTQTNGLVLLYEGQMIGRFGSGTGPITDTASVTKSVIAMAVFKLWDQRRLDLDEPVYTLFSGKLRSLFSDHEHRCITVRHLLTHTSGLPGNNFFLPQDGSRKIYGGDQFKNDLACVWDRNIRAALHKPEYELGKVFDYSNPGTQLLGAVIAGALMRASDRRTVTEFVQQEIFDPLQMLNTSLAEEDGVTVCNGGMRSTAWDLSNLGECIGNLGMWNGAQILTETAVREMLSTPRNIQGAEAHYGHLMCRLTHKVFAAVGDLSNLVFILPYDRITIARTQPVPDGPIYIVTEDNQKRFTPEVDAANLAGSNFWMRLLGAPDSLIAKLRQRNPITKHHHLGAL